LGQERHGNRGTPTDEAAMNTNKQFRASV